MINSFVIVLMLLKMLLLYLCGIKGRVSPMLLRLVMKLCISTLLQMLMGGASIWIGLRMVTLFPFSNPIVNDEYEKIIGIY